ncbi:MAG: acetolactate decarboxylase [Planctomycetota bacterium]|nr:acetolactate decarboxylase [Planctomycetota bacterium]
MRVRLWLVLALAAIVAGCAPQADREVVFQRSVIGALVEGLYDGDMTLGELARHGDFGIGTVDALDGELILLDGRFYQVRSDGKVYRPGPEMKTPFASVTFFDVDRTLTVDRAMSLAQLENLAEQGGGDASAVAKAPAPSINIPMAVRITGTFKYVKTRSVPRQAKPYPRLVDVAARQPTFEFRNVRGVMVGFRLPDYASGINVPGWHMHFLSEDRTGGGHVLEAEIEKVLVEMDDTPALWVSLPQGTEFGKTDLAKDKAEEVRRIEK